jgi:CHAT domain-containing protein
VVWLVSKAGELLTWHRAAFDCAALGMGAEGLSVADVLEVLRIGMKVDGRAGLVRDAGASAGAPVEGDGEVPEASPRDLVLHLASQHRNPARNLPSTGELVQKAQECLATCEDQEERTKWEIVIKELPEVHAWLDAWLEEHVASDDEMRRSAVGRLKSKVWEWQMVRDEVPGVRADASSAAADELALSAYVEAAVREHELVRRWLVKQIEQMDDDDDDDSFMEEVVPPPPLEPMPQIAPRGLAVMTWLTKTIVASVRYRIKGAVVSVVEGVRLGLVLRNLLGTATSWRSLKELLDLLALNRSFHLGKPSGFNWKAIGTCKPASGRELRNARLAHALKTKTELTARQWKMGVDDLRRIDFELALTARQWAWVGIGDLRSDDFIESGGCYFKPVGLSPLQARTLSDLGVSTDPAWADSAAGRFLISRIGALFSHERILKGLHEMLLGPVAAALEEESKQGGEELQELLIIPHQDLFAVPWAALLDGSGKYLIQKYALRAAPSLRVAHQASSALASERDGGGTCHERHAVVVGNPELSEEGRQLPHAEKEAEHVARCLDGNGSTNRRFGRVVKLLKADASKDAVLEALGGTGPQDGAASRPSPRVHWLHLACHFDLSTNALLLARRTASKTLSPRESDLSMEEVRRMVKLPPGCTAVLGACNSGRGEIVSEGVVGLSRSFLAAGAGAVVSSLWTINDASTLVLMARFYEELLRGERVPQALRLAMLSLIESESWMAAPVFWAGFMVVGASTSLLEAGGD